mgnify:FL=1
MYFEKIEERIKRWLTKVDSHPLSKREADLTLLLNNDSEAWERYGKFYKGWTVEEIENLLKAVRTQSSKGL